MRGLSWFAVLKTSSLALATASHAQPLPNRPVAAADSCSLNAAKPPNAFLIASASAPLGSPPPPLPAGAMIVQNSEWLWWPPPLLRTVVRMSSGTLLIPRSSSSRDF